MLLLKAIAASVIPAIESRLSHALPRDEIAVVGGHASEEIAMECVTCQSLQPPGVSSCGSCENEVTPTRVPYVLHGKFRMAQKVGAGSTGVVYRAVDLNLDRAVAIKTLPQISPEQAVGLRREARAVAKVFHPNLAMIYGAETWRGTPMLVFEFLPGGTLADRLASGPLHLNDVVQLGVLMADALEAIHNAGILHRDVKPTNIAYTSNSVPKLLDFGLAHILYEWHGGRESKLEAVTLGTQTTAASTLPDLRSMGVGKGIAGTPLYLSPEALSGGLPDVSFDLWSLGLVLLEALAGRHPLQGIPAPEALERLSEANLPEVPGLVPNCSEAVSTFFREALARQRWNRPSTATEFRERLVTLRVTPAA